ncbi:hypothetical protein KEU06_05510 [Pseudaminobacter sp. 19-2017]|uniref:Uncharacterized protein n=1 Tax=Pseudaminobacter soli (ex Zhang et al. 2022) TaxID=2831468 RepID=A0A942DZP4_9HYPH|nr:hypothetical protein [Pseudaminobacter soli]MBS3648085.1 hypothetical protein [Pseudaminobacter soli]
MDTHICDETARTAQSIPHSYSERLKTQTLRVRFGLTLKTIRAARDRQKQAGTLSAQKKRLHLQRQITSKEV